MAEVTIETALETALEAHRGQVDRYGRPYILHPLRLVARFPFDLQAAMVAALHDVVEDSPLTCADLTARGFPEAVVAAVDALSRRPGESYDALIARAAADPLARRVKLADLEDNMDIRRLDTVTPADAERLERYRRAWHQLAAMT
jgi:(p)ppGpp synthase/HD superfamily hydrolase